MNTLNARNALRLTTIFLLAGTIGGCNVMSRMSEIGDGPKMTGYS